MNEARSKQLRARMINEQIKTRGIANQLILSSMMDIKREDFIESYYYDVAYEDYPITIGYGQTISQPYSVAYMLDKLDLKKTDIVLEIGTGSGYVTALLSNMVKHVYSIERIEALYDRVKAKLELYSNHNITLLFGDGYLGDQAHAPFDKIIVSAASSTIPSELVSQLKSGGKMILPVGNQDDQDLVLIENKNGSIHKKLLGGCRFVAMKKDILPVKKEESK
ncbi:MAG TPA: protein-L-isoaspartate(D-aspartate) O-methyltransferase [Bacilli bacterium]|nr:protein-L-isoaspartate(D-aspartate) O-methyltransferase [Bacilli bacterium]